MPAIWFHSPGLTSWSLLHCSQRHGVPVERLVVLEVRIPRSWLKRVRTEGLHYVLRDVPPERICRILTFHQIATTPEPVI